MDKHEQIILFELDKNNGKLCTYNVHVMYELSAIEIASAVTKLKEEGNLKVEGSNIELTVRGQGYIKTIPTLNPHQHKPWRMCPKRLVIPPLKIHTFYIPRVSLMSDAYRTI